jgi:hypothetical protein
MKDFLQGRPAVASTRSNGPSISLPSSFPPISSSLSLDESQSGDSESHDHSLDTSSLSADSSVMGPQVEIVPDAEGRVGHIVVTCRCGEKITLQCNY